MSTRAAIYARMSTDMQSADSPADQITRCRAYAARHALQVVLVEQDAGISGASRHNRPGLLRLMASIDAWDVLLCWDGSRIARNLEDFGWVLNLLEEHEREGYDVMASQPLASLASQIGGVMNAEERKKIRANTHRGLLGRVERKLAAGAVPYGYRTERIGEGQGSRIVVHEAEADVVRGIFARYASGDGIKVIAKRLNAEGVPTPRPRGHQKHRPRSWSPNAIREMLRNPLYGGELIWNRSRWVKPRHGARRRVERPESEWLRQQDEAWRIVEKGLWAAVQERIAERRGAMQPCTQSPTGCIPAGPARSPRARRLLAGFLACESCGGAFCTTTADTFACSWSRDRGVCASTLRIRYPELEARVLGAIRTQVLVPNAVAYVVERAVALVQQRRADPGLGAKQARLAELPQEIERLVALAMRVEGLDEIAAHLAALKAERARLVADLRAMEAEVDPEALRPMLAEQLSELGAALGADPERARRALVELLRGERLRVGADPERGFHVEGTAWLSVDLKMERPGSQAPRTHSVGSGGLQRPILPTAGAASASHRRAGSGAGRVAGTAPPPGLGLAAINLMG